MDDKTGFEATDEEMGLPHTREIQIPHGLHPNNEGLVVEFAEAMAEKLKLAEQSYDRPRDAWLTQDWQRQCRRQLIEHLAKGDPLDVAAYCAFMWRRRWLTIL